MSHIIALPFHPQNKEECKKLFFGDKKYAFCSSVLSSGLEHEEYPGGLPEDFDLDKSILRLGKKSWRTFVKTNDISEYVSDDIRGKTSLTRDEMIKMISEWHCANNPSVNDFEKEGKIDWESFFEAENKNMESIVDKFISDNEGKFFIVLDGYYFCEIPVDKFNKLEVGPLAL
jgi:hypothetical protein